MNKELYINCLKFRQKLYGDELAKLATIGKPSAYSQQLQVVLFARFEDVTMRLAQLL